MSEHPARQLRNLAAELAVGAGDLLLRSRPSGISTKDTPTDLVTEADRAAEKWIVGRLSAERSDDSIIAEEGSLHEGSTGIRWVIDPLDGTVNFVYGIPHWCVSIGIEGEVRAGVIRDPLRNETFRDDGDLAASDETDLATAMIATGFSYHREVRARQAAVAAHVVPHVRDIRRFGSQALDLAWVAAGRFDAFYEDDSSHWDYSAGLALVEGAGGATRLHGRLVLAAGNPTLLDRLEVVVLEAYERVDAAPSS
ncbi:MAG: inositol monophosphatase family protein [Actinomycetota bacterium]